MTIYEINEENTEVKFRNNKIDVDEGGVFQVRFTKEIFTSYEEYIDKLTEYRQRKFQSTQNQQSGDLKPLNMEEAFAAESRVKEYKYKLSLDLMLYLLRKIQYNYEVTMHTSATSKEKGTRFEGVIDYALKEVETEFFVGDYVMVNAVTGVQDSAAALEGVVLREVGSPSKKRSYSSFQEDTDEVKFYEVEVYLGKDKKKVEVKGSTEIQRPKNTVTKALLRVFLKDAIQKEVPNTSITTALVDNPVENQQAALVWSIRPTYLSELENDLYKLKYDIEESHFDKLKKELDQLKHIQINPSQEVYDYEKNRFKSKKQIEDFYLSKSMKKRKSVALDVTKLQPSSLPKNVKFPVEDSEIPHYAGKDYKPLSSAVKWKKDFIIPNDLVGRAVLTYSFLFNFARVLGLFPFTFDDYCASLIADGKNGSETNDEEDPDFIEDKIPILDEILYCMTRIVGAFTWTLVHKAVKQGYRHSYFLSQFLMSSDATNSNAAALKEDDNEESSVEEDEPPEESSQENDVGSSQEAQESMDANDNDEKEEVSNMQDNYDIGGFWWRWRINRQSYMCVLTAYLINIHPAAASLQSIVQKLTQGMTEGLDSDKFSLVPSAELNELLWKNLYTLTTEERLDLIEAIIHDRLFMGAKDIRKFLDMCWTKIQELRKDKRTIESERKDLLNQLKDIEQKEEALKKEAEEKDKPQSSKKKGKAKKKSEAATSQEETPKASVATEENVLEQGEFDDEKKRIEELKGKVDTASNRQEKLKIQQEIKELEELISKTVSQRIRAIQKEETAKKRGDSEARKRIESSLAALDKEELDNEKEMRLYTGPMRIRPLGRDRYWNRYYYLESQGSGLDAVYDYYSWGPRGQASLNFTTGRILIEGAGKTDYLGYVSSTVEDQQYLFGRRKNTVSSTTGGNLLVKDPFVTLPFGYNGKAVGAALEKNFLQVDEWVSVDDEETLTKLVESLDERGVREKALKTILEDQWEVILHSMKKRRDFVENGSMVTADKPVSTSQRRTRSQLDESTADFEMLSYTSKNNTKNEQESYLAYANKWLK